MSQSIDSYKLGYSFTKNPKTRFKEINFGAGYRQIITDGLNANEENWNIEFIPMDSTAAYALEVILLNSVTSSSNFISWTPPGEDTALLFTAHEISKKPVSHNLWLISCTLRKEFLLG